MFITILRVLGYTVLYINIGYLLGDWLWSVSKSSSSVTWKKILWPFLGSITDFEGNKNKYLTIISFLWPFRMIINFIALVLLFFDWLKKFSKSEVPIDWIIRFARFFALPVRKALNLNDISVQD